MSKDLSQKLLEIIAESNADTRRECKQAHQKEMEALANDIDDALKAERKKADKFIEPGIIHSRTTLHKLLRSKKIKHKAEPVLGCGKGFN